MNRELYVVDKGVTMKKIGIFHGDAYNLKLVDTDGRSGDVMWADNKAEPKQGGTSGRTVR